MTSYTVTDRFLSGIFEAHEAMQEWEPLSDYSILFEAEENPEVAEKVKKNESIMHKAAAGVKKAIDAVLETIRKFFAMIQDFIARLTMKGDEKAQFDAFRRQMNSDPELKNKKITVKDYRELNKEYDKMIAEIEKAEREVRANEKKPIDELIQKGENFLKTTGVSATTIISADVAIRAAESNVTVAKALSTMLKTDKGAMEHLSKELGDKQMHEFESRVDKAAKNSMLTRLKLKILRRRYSDMQSCIKGTIDSLLHAGFINPFTFMGKAAWKNENTKKVNDFAVKVGTAGAAAAASEKLGVRKAVQDSAAKAAVKEAKRAAKQAQAKVAATKREANDFNSFMFGTNKKK